MKRVFGLTVILWGLLFSASPGLAQNHEGCLTEAIGSLSFLAGEWRVESRFRGSDGEWEETVARSRITSELGGCVLRERFSGSRGGKPFEAIALLAYSSLHDRFQRSWIDDGHGLLVFYEGVRTEDELVLEARLTIGDREILFQHRYTELAQDSFRLESRRSLNDGETWNTGWHLLYRRDQ